MHIYVRMHVTNIYTYLHIYIYIFILYIDIYYIHILTHYDDDTARVLRRVRGSRRIPQDSLYTKTPSHICIGDKRRLPIYEDSLSYMYM